MPVFNVTRRRVEPGRAPDYVAFVLRHLVPLYNREAGQSWVRVCVNEREPEDVLVVAQVESAAALEQARSHLKADQRAKLESLLVADPSAGRRTYRMLRSVERFAARSAVLVAVLSRIERSQTDAFLSYYRGLQDRLAALPGTNSSTLLVDEQDESRLLHVLEFADQRSERTAHEARVRDGTFWEGVDRVRFVGTLTHAWDRWDPSQQGSDAR